MISLDSSLWIDKNDKGFLGKGRIELLKQIDKHGSLSKAAKAMKMSYKAAWDSLNEMKHLSDEELIVSQSGGKSGGGSKLTQKAYNYIKTYELLYNTQQQFLKSIESHTDDVEELQQFLQRNSLRTSARNQLFGTIEKIEKGKINSILTIKIDKNTKLKASITNESIKELGIKKNKKVYALIKASWVEITTRQTDNSLQGEIKSIKKEQDIVQIQLYINEKLTITSVMNLDKFDSLHVNKKQKVFASFKPSDTIIGV
jgi:molybdate transport system regulatory protein